MKLPRNVSGAELARRLQRVGYRVTHQEGTYLRLTTAVPAQHHIMVPPHDPLRDGTLAAILGDVANHTSLARAELIDRLFS